MEPITKDNRALAKALGGAGGATLGSILSYLALSRGLGVKDRPAQLIGTAMGGLAGGIGGQALAGRMTRGGEEDFEDVSGKPKYNLKSILSGTAAYGIPALATGWGLRKVKPFMKYVGKHPKTGGAGIALAMLLAGLAGGESGIFRPKVIKETDI